MRDVYRSDSSAHSSVHLHSKWEPKWESQAAVEGSITPARTWAFIVDRRALPLLLLILTSIVWRLQLCGDPAMFALKIWGLFAPFAVGAAGAATVYNLSTIAWTAGSEALNISVPGSVPSHIHLDLFNAGVIGDPYYGLNDFNLRWVAMNNWTYSATLPIAPNKTGNLWLLFNGLDTFTSINLCGQHVASTNNQFRQYYFEVTKILANCTDSPDLSINFGSVPNIANKIAEQPGQNTWPPGVQVAFQFPNKHFVRKEQSDLGWDWGPAFCPVGLWQPAFAIELKTSEDIYVRNSVVDIYRLGQRPLISPDQSKPWVLNASIDVLGHIPAPAGLTFKLTDSAGNIVKSGTLENITIADGKTITGSISVPADAVKLWWPVGFGNQTLYDLELGIYPASGPNSRPLGTVKKRVGFRTIVLNQEPIRPDQLEKGIAPGNNWQFLINGREFYAKGSNFIPPDAFWTRVTDVRIRQLFNSVVAGNQNMLRVWSSGAYSPDFIYDIADELGILLWSEFEFGDALYPVDAEFLANVREEAHYQVRRVNHHASLALWAGGNELENLMLATVRRTAPEELDRLTAEYEKLFLDTLVPAVFENSRSISYTPSSSGTGWLSLNFSKPQPITQRYENRTEGHIYGNTDYYNYRSEFAFDTSSYPVGRFSNEFGYHSMPSLQTWRQALPPKELYFNSSTIQARNHHYPVNSLDTTDLEPSQRGMAEMTLAAQRYYPTSSKREPVANFSAWCHATQLFQADFYKSQIMFYRRGSGRPERQLGSLYWQLEDIWQAPTWAGIEYDGRWKVLHHVAKDIYSNVIIAPFYDQESGILEAWAVSDLWDPIRGAVDLTWGTWNGTALPAPTGLSSPSPLPVTVGAINATRILQTNLTAYLQTASVDPRDLVLRLRLTAQGRLPNTDKELTFSHTNHFHAVPLSQARLVDPGLSARWLGPDTYAVRAERAVAAWVWIDYPAGVVVEWSDNAFWLAAGEEKNVTFRVVRGVGDGWKAGVTVQSLWDLGVP